MMIIVEESCFYMVYLGIILIYFEGIFLINIIVRQLNGEMSIEIIGYNYLNFF